MIRISKIAQGFSKTEKIIFQYKKKNCLVTLNNEKNLNALDLDMIRAFKSEINHWRSNNISPELLILTSNPGSKSFCAGGDIKAIYNLKMNGAKPDELVQYFKEEYELDYMLSQLPQKGTTTVSLWKGIVMGGGVGLSINSNFKVACEDAVLAMPEALIGLFTDVGAVYHLAKLPDGLREAVALGGMRLKGSDLIFSGIANAFVAKEKFEEVEKALFNWEFKGSINKNKQIEEYLLSQRDLKKLEENKNSFESKIFLLGKIFNGNSFEKIMQAQSTKLLSENFPDVKRNLENSSPLSLKIIHSYLRNSKGKSLKETFLSDFRLVKHFMSSEEFFIGVKSLLMDKSKEKPKWTYSSLDEIPDKIVKYFLYESCKESHAELNLDE